MKRIQPNKRKKSRPDLRRQVERNKENRDRQKNRKEYNISLNQHKLNYIKKKLNRLDLNKLQINLYLIQHNVGLECNFVKKPESTRNIKLKNFKIYYIHYLDVIFINVKEI